MRSEILLPSAAEFTLFTIIFKFISRLSTSVAMIFIIPYASVIAVGSAVVTTMTSSADATKLTTFFETPALVSIIMISVSDKEYNSWIKAARSSSFKFAILENPDAPAMSLIPKLVSMMISDIFFCFLITWYKLYWGTTFIITFTFASPRSASMSTTFFPMYP